MAQLKEHMVTQAHWGLRSCEHLHLDTAVGSGVRAPQAAPPSHCLGVLSTQEANHTPITCPAREKRELLPFHSLSTLKIILFVLSLYLSLSPCVCAHAHVCVMLLVNSLGYQEMNYSQKYAYFSFAFFKVPFSNSSQISLYKMKITVQCIQTQIVYPSNFLSFFSPLEILSVKSFVSHSNIIICSPRLSSLFIYIHLNYEMWIYYPLYKNYKHDVHIVSYLWIFFSLASFLVIEYFFQSCDGFFSVAPSEDM